MGYSHYSLEALKIAIKSREHAIVQQKQYLKELEETLREAKAELVLRESGKTVAEATPPTAAE